MSQKCHITKKKSKNETRANVQNICADSANPNQKSSNKIPTVLKKYKKLFSLFPPIFFHPQNMFRKSYLLISTFATVSATLPVSLIFLETSLLPLFDILM
jgi:hypothetical protein